MAATITLNAIKILMHLATTKGSKIVHYVGIDTYTRHVDMDNGSEGWRSFEGLNNATFDSLLMKGLVERADSREGGRTNYYKLSTVGRMVTDAVRLTAAPKKPRRLYVHPAGR